MSSRGLTPGMIRVVEAMSYGLTAVEAGEVLGRSDKTVKAQLQNARIRARARNTTHLIAIALRKGWIE